MTALLQRNRRADFEETDNDMPHQKATKHQYSLLRAIKNAAENDGALRSGLEAEVSQELAIQRGRQPSGFLVPLDATVGKRSLDSATTGVGTVQTNLLTIVDVLRAKLALSRLGCQVLDLPATAGRGNVSIPVKTAAGTLAWIAEGIAASATNFTVTQQMLRPKTVSAYTDVTRTLLALVPGNEAVVIGDLTTSIASAIDLAGINGSGNNNQPLGLLQHQGLLSITASADSGNGGAHTYLDLTAMEYKIGASNGDAPMSARVGLLTSPAGRNALRNTDLGGATVTGLMAWRAEQMVIDGQLSTVETCIGHPAIATTAVPANLTHGSGTSLTTAVMGNFADQIVGLFSGFDVIVNPYLQSTNGVVRVSVFQDVDITVRHYASFCRVSGWICPTVT